MHPRLVHVHDDPLQVGHFLQKASLHRLCDTVTLDHGQTTVDTDMGLHLVKAPGGLDPETMHVHDALTRCGPGMYGIQDFLGRGRKFLKTVANGVETHLDDKESAIQL